MKIFIPLTEDADPDLPPRLLTAIVNVTRRNGKDRLKPALSKKAKTFAKPYAHRAKELLHQEGDWK